MTLNDLKTQFGEEIESAEQVGRELRLRLRPSSLVACCQFCKDRGHGYLADITAVDTGSEMRVVYRLVSLQDRGVEESKGREVGTLPRQPNLTPFPLSARGEGAAEKGEGLAETRGEVPATHLVISVPVSRTGGSVPSVTSVFKGANWTEREVYDLFGVRFPGHPDLRRILLTDDWQGHPLLKAGPAQGK
jgi:NADH:ubiquinone oxidoreductase subunit C